MNEASFFDLIKKKTISGLYILSGNEEYSKEKAIRQCLSLTNEATRDLNTQTMESPSSNEVLSVCETLPFFDDIRVILIQNFSTDELNNLSEQCDNIPDYCVVLVRKVGTIAQNSIAYKNLSKKDRIINFAPYNHEHAVLFVERCCKLYGLSINPGAKSFLVDYIGTSLSSLENYLLILDAYVGHGNEITIDAIKTCTIPSIENKTYEITDCFFQGNMKKGLFMLQNELKEGRLSIPQFIGLMDKDLKSLISAYEMKQSGHSEKEYLPLLSKNEYVSKKKMNLLKKYPVEDLKKILIRILKVDENIKKNGYNDTTAFITAICQCFMRCPND